MSDWRIQDEGNICKNSAFDLLVGKCIGSGASRRVYELIHDKSIVLKLEYSGRTFHNQTEWSVWREMKNWPISDRFVPCIDIDGYGNCLIQKRSEVFECEKDFHAALARTRGGVIPKIMGDIHYGNFGLYDGRVACHDYGYHHFFSRAARAMSQDAGYLDFDEPEKEAATYDVVEGNQYALNL